MTTQAAQRLMTDKRQTNSSPQEVVTLLPRGINFCGYLRTESGVGAAARGYVRALKSAGLPLALLDISDLQTNRSQDRFLDGFGAEHPYDVNLICAHVEL